VCTIKNLSIYLSINLTPLLPLRGIKLEWYVYECVFDLKCETLTFYVGKVQEIKNTEEVAVLAGSFVDL
jgi:hypothetical protein